MLDTKLNFLPHIKSITAKAECIFNSIVSMARRHYQIDPKRVLTYYEAIYVALIGYAAPSFLSRLDIKEIKNKMSISQRKVLRRLTRAYSTTPVETLQIVASIQPLDLQIKSRAIKYLQKRELAQEYLSTHA